MQWSKYLALWPSFKCLLLSLLQETEMALLFLLMCATAVVLSSFNNTCSLVLFLQKAFKQKKAGCNSREFIFHTIPLPLISVTWSAVHPQPSKLVSEKVVRSNCRSLMGAKASKMFLIHLCNSFAGFLWDINFPFKIATRSSLELYVAFFQFPVIHLAMWSSS